MRGGGGEGVDTEGGRTRAEKEKKGWVGVGGRTSRKQGAEIPCFRPTMGAGLCWEGWSTSQAGPAIKNLNETSVEAEPEGENVVLLFSHTDNLFSFSLSLSLVHSLAHWFSLADTEAYSMNSFTSLKGEEWDIVLNVLVKDDECWHADFYIFVPHVYKFTHIRNVCSTATA